MTSQPKKQFKCEKAIRKNDYRLIVIDDMAHLDHYHADILLNQNIHASSLRYSCERDTVKLLGCEYVLLRMEFLKYKDWKRDIPYKAKNILVTMGGGDPDNVTLKVIRALNSLYDWDLEVIIVAGPAGWRVKPGGWDQCNSCRCEGGGCNQQGLGSTRGCAHLPRRPVLST